MAGGACIFPHAHFETAAWSQKKYVCGMDEVGRGALAGPVVVAAVILPLDCPIDFKDSKALSVRQRELAYAWLIKHAWYAVGGVSHRVVDAMNVYQATRYLMHRVYTMLYAQCGAIREDLAFLVVDAMDVQPKYDFFHKKLAIYHFNYGESISPSIAAASIIAKVMRDRIMLRMSDVVPQYDFARHKGYGTKLHRREVHDHGGSFLHRKSFAFHNIEESDREQQLTFIEVHSGPG